jgi:histidinol-phosphate phosphatase family protein
MKDQVQWDSYTTLFLDRDGTINTRKRGGYISSWKEFEFLPGALEAIYRFSHTFEHIIIVTNQQGIGKGLMTHEELNLIHENMITEIKNSKGRVDQIYYCPHLDIFNPLCRKPNPGMAFQAQEDFPQIVFENSIMVGDTDSDIIFGNQLGMFTVRIKDGQNEENEIADLKVKSLFELSQIINT